MSRSDILNAIRELGILHNEGILTEDEFAKEKGALLAELRKIRAKSPMPPDSVLFGPDLFSTGGGVQLPLTKKVVEEQVPILDIEVGCYLLERYRLDRLLGEGGMGRVFLCTDTLTNQSYALKVILPHLAQEPGVRQRFITELNLTQQLTHVGIVRGYSMHQDRNSGVFFYTMEYVEGVTLESVLARAAQAGTTPPIPMEQTLDIIQRLATVLEYAHAHGVIHRDLKPANIMLLPNGHIKLMDFGIAKVLSGTHTTKHTGHIGSAYYMAPEQLRGREATTASDVYSFGVITYQMLTGQIPIGRFVQPHQICSALPTGLGSVLLEAVDPDSSKRTASALEFCTKIQELFEAASHERAVSDGLAKLLASNDLFEILNIAYDLDFPTDEGIDEHVAMHMQSLPTKYALKNLKKSEKMVLAFALRHTAIVLLEEYDEEEYDESEDCDESEENEEYDDDWTRSCCEHTAKGITLRICWDYDSEIIDIWVEDAPPPQKVGYKVFSMRELDCIVNFGYGPWMNALIPGSYVL